MAQSKNALIQIETGQSLVASAAMTDSGDQTVYTVPYPYERIRERGAT